MRLDDIGELGWRGILFLALMIILVRPASVFLSMIRTDLNLRERFFIAGLAPRGIVAAAVTAVFALKVQHLTESSPEFVGMGADAAKLVPITFLVIIGTVIIYGLGAAPFARWLGVGEISRQGILFAGADNFALAIAKKVNELGIPVLMVDTHYQNVSTARIAGIPAECVSILSGIGRVLAMTPNNEVNAMAAEELKHLFGRENAFRLYAGDLRSGKRSSITGHHPGRRLFAKRATFAWLHTQFEKGWVLKSTRLTETFGYEKYQEIYGDGALVMFVLDGNQTLSVIADDSVIVPKAGQTLIALVDPNRATEQIDEPSEMAEAMDVAPSDG